MALPIPEPPPVTKAVFPLVENSGRFGEMTGYVDWW